MAATLPETAAVHWRPRASPQRLRRRGWLWTATTATHTVPFAMVAALLFALEPLTFPVGLALLAHAWGIPAIYANRGANVLKPRRRLDPGPEQVAVGLLGDLVGHSARDVYRRTGLVPERGTFGTWLVGEAGAVLVRPGSRRVDCWCVRVNDPDLPGADRTAHLLLALREDEAGFATVANLAFSGARWRLARHLTADARQALAWAAGDARS